MLEKLLVYIAFVIEREDHDSRATCSSCSAMSVSER